MAFIDAIVATNINLLPSTGLNLKSGKTNIRSPETLGPNEKILYVMDEKTTAETDNYPPK